MDEASMKMMMSFFQEAAAKEIPVNATTSSLLKKNLSSTVPKIV